MDVTGPLVFGDIVGVTLTGELFTGALLTGDVVVFIGASEGERKIVDDVTFRTVNSTALLNMG